MRDWKIFRQARRLPRRAFLFACLAERVFRFIIQTSALTSKMASATLAFALKQPND